MIEGENRLDAISPARNITSGMSETIWNNLSDRIIYNPEFDRREDVKKIYIVRDVPLYFIPIEWSDKYVFCSADEKLQEWCGCVKHKNIKWKSIRYIVDAAKKYMKGETQLPEKNGSSVYANWRDNPVCTLQNILQKQWKMPEYSIVTENAQQLRYWGQWFYLGGVAVSLSVGGYDDVIVVAQNQKEARKACAIKFAKECLWIDVETEQDLVTWKPKTQQMEYQTEKLPDSFKVSPDECGNRDEDAVSALQVFCQKNKLWMPKYIPKGTSQWYITESTVRMELWEFSTTQSAPTKQGAKQKCAKAFYENLKSGSLNRESELQKDVDETPNPALFKWWKSQPRLTLENYCNRYNIYLNIDDEWDEKVLTVWDEKFYTDSNEYTNGGIRYKRDWEVKDELARFCYDTKIKPILKKQAREKIFNASEDVLDNFPIVDMTTHKEKGNVAWTWVLNQLCARAHILTPWYETYKLKDWVETKCPFPAKINIKSW